MMGEPFDLHNLRMKFWAIIPFTKYWMVDQSISQILMMKNFQYGAAIIFGLLDIPGICLNVKELLIGISIFTNKKYVRKPKSKFPKICHIFVYFFSHHHTSCIEDCNDMNDWNVWNGIDWKTATDLTIDAICKIWNKFCDF